MRSSAEHDDRGRPVRLMSPLRLFRLSRASATAKHDRRALRQILRADPRIGSPLRLATVLILFAAAFYFLVSSIMHSIRAGGWSNIHGVQYLLMAFLAFSVLSFIAGWFKPSRVIAALLLRDGRCCSCGHPIATLPPRDDNRVVCPECGAAWKSPAPESRPE